MLGAQTHRRIYLVLLTLLGGTMVTSVWASNLMWVLLGVNWLLEGRWGEKWQMARQSRLLHAYLVLYAVLLAGMLWTTNQATGWTLLREKLPLLVVPLVLLTTRPPHASARRTVGLLFSGTVVVVSIISTIRLFTIPDLPYRDAVPYISHIRFALCCCMAVFLLLGEANYSHRWWPLLVSLWLLIFVVLIHSYTAVFVLALVTLVVLLVYQPQPLLLGMWIVLFGSAVGMVSYYARDYYRPQPAASQPLRACTPNGNPYHHQQDGIMENGNYINNYLCLDELRREWERRSPVPYDAVLSTGYTVQPTLVRYLNALGLPKDSLGVSQLSPTQLHQVEQGVCNPVYLSHNPVRKMVYVMLFEYEYYRHTNAVAGFTMLQRFELWKSTLRIVGQRPWLGVGTGDVAQALDQELVQSHSSLAGSGKHTHNQYLSLLAAVGIVGCVIILAFFVRAVVASRRSFDSLMLAWLLLVLISCLTEDTLDTLAGILLCTYFLAFRTTTCTNTTHSPTASE